MLRVRSETGWWLITHPDHAHLAAAIAAHWGNQRFVSPSPRMNVLHAIRVHDDGWTARDAHPSITRDGIPSAFSEELVGKYSAFEEIDLGEYLSVRESALDLVERQCPYAALLVSMHTYNLLTARADRSTIPSDQVALLDSFLERQLERQEFLRLRIRADLGFSEEEVADGTLNQNFQRLQATDNLSLYSCVGHRKTGNLLYPHLTTDGGYEQIEVLPIGPRQFRLKPYPLDEPLLTFTIPARHVEGITFKSSEELATKYAETKSQQLRVKLVE